MGNEHYFKKLVSEICTSFDDDPVSLFNDINDGLYNINDIKSALYKHKGLLSHNERVKISKIINEYTSYFYLKDILKAYKSGMINTDKFLNTIKDKSHLLMSKKYFKDEPVNIDDLIKKLKNKSNIEVCEVSDAKLLYLAKLIVLTIRNNPDREFDLIDYYNLCKISPSELLKNVENNMNKNDLKVLKEFASKYIDDKELTEEETNNIKDALSIKTLEELYELDIPITMYTLKCMINRKLSTKENKTLK